MSDKTDVINETDDEELVVVELAEGETEPAPAEAAPADDAEGDDDDDDERLAGDAEADEDDDPADDAATRNRKRRQKRKEITKRARERAEQELAYLREQTAIMAQRLAAVEGHALSRNEQDIDVRINAALQEAETAKTIMERAIDAGNGADVTAALAIREQALARANQLHQSKQQLAAAREQAAQPRMDPRVGSYAQEWLQANPWFDPQGRDEDSAVASAIDAAMTRQGLDPTTREYWEELTRRVSQRIAPPATEGRPPAVDGRRKTPPPQGNSREHAPTTTRREVFVTPERKQAMIEAGYWDDPVKRNQMLKAYQAHDRSSAS